jgi:hypothetical protein
MLAPSSLLLTMIPRTYADAHIIISLRAYNDGKVHLFISLAISTLLGHKTIIQYEIPRQSNHYAKRKTVHHIVVPGAYVRRLHECNRNLKDEIELNNVNCYGLYLTIMTYMQNKQWNRFYNAFTSRRLKLSV